VECPLLLLSAHCSLLRSSLSRPIGDTHAIADLVALEASSTSDCATTAAHGRSVVHVLHAHHVGSWTVVGSEHELELHDLRIDDLNLTVELNASCWRKLWVLLHHHALMLVDSELDSHLFELHLQSLRLHHDLLHFYKCGVCCHSLSGRISSGGLA
jgi:hypothetical protein